jgi:hypothetical protein
MSVRDFPSEIVVDVRDMADQCEDAGGKPRNHKFIKHGTLSGDGMDVWVVDAGEFRCDGVPSGKNLTLRSLVIPAKAGILCPEASGILWIPAFAGMTAKGIIC